jgi:cysteine synthase A
MRLDSVEELIGNTPLVRLTKLFEEEVYAKIEKNNLTGSIKDRPSLNMLKVLIEQGKIKANDTIIEPTSGNTGISLASLANRYELNCIIVMPTSSSLERRKLIESYNAKIVLVEGGMDECVKKAKQLNKQIINSHIIGQFINKDNYLSHYFTAKEIISDFPDVEVIICGIGSGGTITGVGKYVKENNFNIEIIGVEPLESPLITKKYSRKHKIQGLGPDFIPEILDQSVIDKMVLVSEDDAIYCAKLITKKEGLLVGISSGALVSCVKQLLQDNAYKNKKIVMIFPDTGERYSWMEN